MRSGLQFVFGSGGAKAVVGELGWGRRHLVSADTGGAHVWWSLPNVYRSISGPAHKKWHKFREKVWDHWRKMAVDLCGLGPCSLLDAFPSDGGPWPWCPFPWAAASTHTLILMLVRLAGPWVQNGRSDNLQPAAERLNQDLFSHLPVSFQLVVSDGAVWDPPYNFTRGGEEMTFAVEGGRVDLCAARSAQPLLFSYGFPTLEGDDCTLLELLEADPVISQCQCRDTVFLPQLVAQLGSLLELQLLDLSVETLSRRSWRDVSAARTAQLRDLSYDQRLAALATYGDLSAEILAQQRVVVIAADDARVARRNWKVVGAAAPGLDLTFWLFPQAPQGGGSNEGGNHVLAFSRIHNLRTAQ